MKLLHLFYLCFMILPCNALSIKNQNKPTCYNCKHYLSTKRECKKFGKMDLVTGEYKYDEASLARIEKEKCGEDALFFEKNNIVPITRIRDFLLEYKLVFSFLSLYSFIFNWTLNHQDLLK